MSGNGSRRPIASHRLSLQSTIKKFSNCNACNKDKVQLDLLLSDRPIKQCLKIKMHDIHVIISWSYDLDKELHLITDVRNI